MTQVKGYAMTSDRGTFVQDATAFRNARNLARQHRDHFIQAANATASQHSRTALADVPGMSYGEVSSPPGPTDHSHHASIQDADYELQRIIAGASYDSEDDTEPPPVFRDDSQEASQEPETPSDDPSMSFTSSFTSELTTDRSPSKRSRESLSLPSGGSHVSKRRTGSTTSH